MRNDDLNGRVAEVVGEVPGAVHGRVDPSAAATRALGAQREVAVVGADLRALDVSARVSVAVAVVGLVALDRDELDLGRRVAAVVGEQIDVHLVHAVVRRPEHGGVRNRVDDRRGRVAYRDEHGVRADPLRTRLRIGERHRERHDGTADRERSDRGQAGRIVERDARRGPQVGHVIAHGGAEAVHRERRAVLADALDRQVRTGICDRELRLRARHAGERDPYDQSQYRDPHESDPSAKISDWIFVDLDWGV